MTAEKLLVVYCVLYMSFSKDRELQQRMDHLFLSFKITQIAYTIWNIVVLSVSNACKNWEAIQIILSD
jgi:hypothetical protein